MRMKWLAAALLLLAGEANAAVSTNSIVTAQTPNRGIVQFTSASSPGTYATLYTAGTNGSKCLGMYTNNNDPSATHLLTVQLVNSTVKYGGISVTTISSAGFSGTVPPQAMMTAAVWPGLPSDSDGNPFFFMASGDTLQATFATAITSSDVVNIQVVCADF